MSKLSGMSEDQAFYDQLKGELIPEFLNQYVLIQGGSLVGVFSTYQGALDEATAKFGAMGGGEYLYLIKEVLAQEPVETL